jgi:hypothetical protein
MVLLIKRLVEKVANAATGTHKNQPLLPKSALLDFLGLCEDDSHS